MLASIPLFATSPEVLYTIPAHDGRTMTIAESQGSKVRPTTSLGPYATWLRPSSRPRPAVLPRSSEDGIAYGTSVSRNEFGISGGVFPSPCGTMNAVYRKDERAVTFFPLLDINSRTGSLVNLRYPMNGMASEHIDLCVCDTLGNIISTLDVTDFSEERYLTGISWSADSRSIFVQVVDREQHHMHLNQYRAADGSFVRTIFCESNSAWIEPEDPVWPIGEGFFLYRTDNRDGYRNLYLCDTLGTVRRLTCVDADVQYVGQAECKGGWWVYYTSAEVSPVENHLFRIKVSGLKADRRQPMRAVGKAKFGTPERLTTERGWHNVRFNEDMSMFMDSWDRFDDPGAVDIRNADGSLVEQACRRKDPLDGYAVPEVEFGTIPAADGSADNYYRFFKPVNFDPSRKYPLIVYVYGGPHSQMVKDSWMGQIRMWELAMAQRGYAVYVQDNRGTSNRGSAFEKAINRRCGQEEAADQLAGIDALLERCPWIDRERIGVHGWSYGGFMTITLSTSRPGFFKTAVAGGPVIDWKWYEVMYGERYMDTEATNPEGFAETSLLSKAKDLKTKLLICQGAIDDTVVWEHSLSFINECIEAGVPVDYFPYPVSKHNMAGKARIHLYEKITGYFEDYL